LSIKATTPFGVIAMDFIIRVSNFPVSGYSSITYTPLVPAYTYQKYSLLPGDSISFKLQCGIPSKPDAKYYLTTPVLYDGLTINGGLLTTLSVTPADQVTVAYSPKLSNPYADSDSYVLTFYCRDIATYDTKFYSIIVYVAKPLVITVPPPKTLGCHPHCGCLDETILGTATATDACCGLPTITYTDTTADGSCNQKIYRNWTAVNNCGQQASGTQIITINDITPPEISSCDDEHYQCYDQIYPTSTPTASDTCGNTVLDFYDSGAHGNCNVKFTRTWTATDDCGNVATLNQNVYVNDDTPPTLVINTENPLKVECPADCELFNGIVTTIDNCDGILDSTYKDDVKVTCGKFKRTWTSTDKCGNIGTYSATLEVGHSHLPTFNPPSLGYYTSQCYEDTKKIPPPTAISYCKVYLNVTLDHETVDNTTCVHLVTRVWRATDECGNTNTYTQQIPVKDNTPPTFEVPKDFTTECGGYVDTTRAGTPTCLADNCGYSQNPWYVDGYGSGGCNDCFTRTWYFQDNCGNVCNKPQKICRVDTQPPTYTPPADYTGVCPGDEQNAPKPTGLYDCHNATTAYKDTIVSQSYKCTDMLINRTWIISDNCYHSTLYYQTIKIEDNIPPSVTWPCDITVECFPKSFPNVTGYPHATDNCGVIVDDIVYVDKEIRDVTYNTIKQLIRTWTVKDACGNTVKKNQTITFNNSLPFLTCPNDVDYDCPDNYGPKVAGWAIAGDACVGNLTPTYHDDLISDCASTNGVYTDYIHIVRTWRVFDYITGKSAECRQNIYIGRKKAGPFIKSPGDRSVQCTNDIYPTTNGVPCVSPVCPQDKLTNPTYEDSTDSYDQCSDLFSFTRTWKVSDQCGLSSSAKQIIRIHDYSKPVIKLPSDCFSTCRFKTDVDHCCKASAFDNCNGDDKITISHSDSVTPSDSVCPTTIYRTWTATDCSGNTISGIQTITINETGPVFQGYWTPFDTIDKVECENCAKIPTIKAIDTCGRDVPVTVVVTKSGTCPTILTLTYTATDSCGRQAVLVLYIKVLDTTPPVINHQYAKDEINVQCENQIPAVGIVSATDNCDGILVPTFTDITLDNCTCATCSRTIVRTWFAIDNCGNKASWTQTINLRKTNPPKLVVPKDITISCGSPYSADYTGTGVATATDFCGLRLYVSHTDKVTTEYGGAMTITRTWTTVDNCAHTVSGVQIISVKGDDYLKPYTFNIPGNQKLPCGSTVYGGSAEYASGQSFYDYDSPVYLSQSCGIMTVDNSIKPGRSFTVVAGGDMVYHAECPELPGHYVRVWEAKRNGVSIGKTLEQYVDVDDCPPRGSGIYNVPRTPQKCPSESTITPTVTIIDADLPCEVFTIKWSWGDGTYDTYTCDPEKLDSTHCKLDTINQMTSWYSHTYYAAGVFTISVTISGLRAGSEGDDYASDYGNSFVRFWTSFQTYDPYSGSAIGTVDLIQSTTDDDEVQGYGEYKCKLPWVVRAYTYNSDLYLNQLNDKYCGGKATLKFAARFTKDNYTVKADGNTYLDWDSCGIEFEENLAHLSLFADGISALWVGEGTYVGEIPATFSLYAVDGGGPASAVGDKVHIRIIEKSTGKVLFDTDPCMQIDADWKVQPQTQPNSILDQNSIGFSILNPTGGQISAIGSEDYLARNGIPVGLIVGIVIGLLLFTVLVAGVVYYLLTRVGRQDDTFIKMT